MKRLLIVTSLMVMTFFTNSQVLVEETKVWNNVECLNFGGCWTYSYKIIGDTTINQINYKKLYSISDSIKTNRGFYAIREHEKQVFLYNFEDETEEILYDFNLSVDDHFITTINSDDYHGCQINIKVNFIDSVTILNGERRKRFHLSIGEEWIEGIGSLNGIFYVGVYMCGADIFYDLSCCHLNGEKIFQSTLFDHCYVNTVGYEEISEEIKHSIYTNPFSQSAILKFDYSSSQTYRLQIINITGQIIKEIEDINSDEIIISGNRLKSGIYFYRLINDGNVIASGKIIKQK